ncbi:MAG: hypothetical protein KA841_00415 [Chitinophagales bacterium]|jgi:hypothetical protein|nr:hypothetical protein [Chitinophagales bacterium]
MKKNTTTALLGTFLLSIICLLLLTLTNCNREEDITLPHQLAVSDLIDSLTGSFTGTDYHVIYGGGVQYDTLYNQALILSKSNDSTIVANGDTLNFKGSLDGKDYLFEWNYTSVYSNKLLRIDSNFNTITYMRTTNNGGFGGNNYLLVIDR